MDYELFLKELLESLKDGVEAIGGGEFKVDQGFKDNKMMDRLSFVPAGESVVVVLYPEYLFEDYQNGRPLSMIVSENVQIFEKHKLEAVDIQKLATEKFQLENVFPTLMPRAGNEKYLEGVPFVEFEDLAITFRVNVNIEELKGTIKIENRHLSMFGVNVQELKEIALKNTVFTENACVVAMDEFMMDILEPGSLPDDFDGGIPMVVISNKDKYFGASVILNTDVMKKVAETLKEDFYILPSSIHECIAVPVGECPEESELREMVREINETQVLPEERLSDQIYRFDSKSLTINMVLEERSLSVQQSEPDRVGR